MWLYLCIFGLMSLPGSLASLAQEMADTTQLCCARGTAYGRAHSSEDCSSSIPPDVPSAFGSLCIFAMDQCCREYFLKKRDCDTGVDIATSNDSCAATKDPTKSCCEECARGKEVGSNAGESACIPAVNGSVAEELLAGDAFEQCCKEAAKKQKESSVSVTSSATRHTPKPDTLSRPSGGSTMASLCEEYAPNELCAHHCIPVPGSYKCECNPGYRLMADGRNCIEVVKNRCKPKNPCQHKCNDNGVEVKCSCRRGYQLKADGKSCEDIDECKLDMQVCLADTDCYNVQGSYKCIPRKKQSSKEKGQCPPGFIRNEQNNACDDVNECTLFNPPCPSYLCENTVGGYKCGGVLGDPANLPAAKPVTDDRCPQGFRAGFNEECEDVDECALRQDDCNHLSQFCINTRGSFYCQNKASKHCRPGFKIDPRTNKCEDINECEDGQDICRPDEICVNEPGEYDCKPRNSFKQNSNTKCPEGMRIIPGTTRCEDIDECAEGTHICDLHQSCLNTNGSHECRCKLGFEVDPITGSCMDVNECATDTHNCIPGSQRCDNTVGSFICVRFTSCGTGYILQASTGQCEDIDECVVGTHNCAYAGPDWHCENHPGSFRCVRNKASTTSTTAAPAAEYEYEYYDSEEEDQAGQTKPEKPKPESKPATETITTTTPEPTKPPTTPKSVHKTMPVDRQENETKPTEPVTPQVDSRLPESYPEPQQPELTKPEVKPNITNQPEELPSTTVVNKSVPQEPDYQRPETYQPDYPPQEPDYQRPETHQPEYPPQSSPNYYEILDPAKPEPNGQTVGNLEPTPPQVVEVHVGKETANIRGEKKDDDSVVLDTKNVPKNEWTKVAEKPSNCQIGFYMDDYGACVDIDECATNKHSCSGLTETCHNTMGGYLCDCAFGFRRDLKTGACDVITSSTTSTTTPSPSTSTESRPTTNRNYFWGYPDYRPIPTRPFRPRTMCDIGYHLNNQTQKCEDINECMNGQANCASVEICVNTEGGYRCECAPNWRLDEIRHRCVPERATGFPDGYGNAPNYQPPTPTEIQQTFKGNQYVDPEVTRLEDDRSIISCPKGYKLGYDNTCEDIDECSTGQAACGSMLCTNLAGGYVCSCPQGHKLVADNRCEDVDECSLGGNMPVCSQNADCINTVGSYQCKCHPGFRSAPINDKVCVDVDECAESPSGSLCQQRCNNLWGGYRCSCHRGYRLNSDNSTCVDVDECKEYKQKLLCVGRCVNEPGTYRCTCPQGYRLSEDKRSCIDIDECETGIATCSKGESYGGSSDVCFNTRGGHRCLKVTCPPGYKLESRHRCTLIEKTCPPADWDCAHQPTTISYNFITFVSNLYVPEAKVDLFTMRGPAWPNGLMRFKLQLINVDTPPSVKEKADSSAFLLVRNGNQAVISLVRSLEGPQSIELELSMESYFGERFSGTAVAKIYIFVTEFEF